MFIDTSNDGKNSLCQKKLFQNFSFLANFGSSFAAYLVHISTFQNKQDSHCLVVPVASVQLVIIDLLNLTGLLSYIILNHCSYS